MSARFAPGRAYDPPSLPPPTAIPPFLWEGTRRLELGAPMNEQTLWILPASFGENLPALFFMAVESALTVALSRSYSGLSDDLARTLVRPVDETMSGQGVALLKQTAFRDRLATELSAATSETRAQMDMWTVCAAAHASLAVQAATPRGASPPPLPAPRGDTGGQNEGYTPHISTPGPYQSPPQDNITSPR